jgi:hypothetical protein
MNSVLAQIGLAVFFFGLVVGAIVIFSKGIIDTVRDLRKARRNDSNGNGSHSGKAA